MPHQHQFGFGDILLGCLAQAGLELLILPSPGTLGSMPFFFLSFILFFLTLEEKKTQAPGEMASGHLYGCTLNWHGLLLQYRSLHNPNPLLRYAQLNGEQRLGSRQESTGGTAP